MSDTPRTDAAETAACAEYERTREAGYPPFDGSAFDIARVLERENAELRKAHAAQLWDETTKNAELRTKLKFEQDRVEGWKASFGHENAKLQAACRTIDELQANLASTERRERDQISLREVNIKQLNKANAKLADAEKERNWFRSQFCTEHLPETDESWTQYGCPVCEAGKENRAHVEASNRERAALARAEAAERERDKLQHKLSESEHQGFLLGQNNTSLNKQRLDALAEVARLRGERR
jgi:hypothetical protein